MKFLKNIFFLIIIICIVASPSMPAFAFIVNDPLVDQQWYLDQIKVKDAWDITLGNDNVVVAVIDTGVDLNHPDINFWRNVNEIPGDGIDNDNNGFVDDYRGWDFVDNDSSVMPEFDVLSKNESYIVHHGTIISGIIAAIPNNREGISGINWKAEIMPIRIATLDGLTDTLKVANAIRYAVDNGANVINLSFISIEDVLDTNLKKQIEYAVKKNVLIVAAAGNGNAETGIGFDADVDLVYPVCFHDDNGIKTVVGVSGTDENDIKTTFSNYGSTCIELAAPSIRIFSTHFFKEGDSQLNKLYGGYWAGTSFAAPMVSGAAAFMKSIYKDITVADQMRLLIETSDDIDSLNPEFAGKVGKRLNILRLVEALFDEFGDKINSSTTNTQPLITSDPESILESPVQEPLVKKEIIEVIEPPLELLEPLVQSTNDLQQYYIAPFQFGKPEVSILDSNFLLRDSFMAFDELTTDGVRFSVVDTAHYGLNTIIVGPSHGIAPWVRIFSANGTLRNEFLAYNENFLGGIRIATGDVDGDGIPDIITAPQKGGGPHIRVFDLDGNVKAQFFAHDSSFRGGVSIASGDIDGDGIDEIITSFGADAVSKVKVFKIDGTEVLEFFAYGESFMGGVEVTVGDITGDNKAEIITGAGPGGGPHIRIFDNDGELISQFLAYDKAFNGGTLVSISKNHNQNKKDSIIVAPQSKGGPHVRIFNILGSVLNQFFAYDSSFRGGVVVRSK